MGGVVRASCGRCASLVLLAATASGHGGQRGAGSTAQVQCVSGRFRPGERWSGGARTSLGLILSENEDAAWRQAPALHGQVKVPVSGGGYGCVGGGGGWLAVV